MNEAGTETIARWDLRGVCPTRFDTAGFVGDADCAIERLDLTFDAIDDHAESTPPAG